MTKKYLKLTKEQKERGVIFSSELIGGGQIHEVLGTDEDIEKTIERLKDDKFFNNSPYSYNEIRS